MNCQKSDSVRCCIYTPIGVKNATRHQCDITIISPDMMLSFYYIIAAIFAS